MKHLTLSAALSALLLSSCSLLGGNAGQPFVWPAAWSDAKPGEAKYGGELRDAYITYMTFNPFTDTDTGGPDVWLGAGTGLYVMNPVTNRALPYMAAAQPSISADGRTYTFQLRQGMRFSDGVEVTAQDFVSTAQIHADKAVKSSLRDNFFSGDQPIVFTAPGKYTLQVVFPVPMATAQSILSFAPWPDHIFGAAYRTGGAAAVAKLWGPDAKPGDIVTAGMWKLGSSANVKGGRVVFVKNPAWGEWNKDSQGQALPYLSGVNVKIVPDDQPFAPLFLSGDMDRTGPTSAAAIKAIQDAVKDGKLNATLLTGIGTRNSAIFGVFNWNKSSDPFKQTLFRDVRFRRAISHLLNRQKMIDEVLGGLGQPSYSIVPNLHAAYLPADLPKFAFDPAAATKLFAELDFTKKDTEGYLVNGDGKRLEFETIGYADANTKKQMDIFVADAQAAGVKVTFKGLSGDDLFGLIGGDPKTPDNRNFDFAVYASAGFDPVWPFFGTNLLCDGEEHDYNHSGKCLTPEETQMAELYNLGNRQINDDQRIATGQQLTRLLGQTQVFIPVINNAFNVAYNNRLGGAYPRELMNALRRERTVALTFIK